MSELEGVDTHSGKLIYPKSVFRGPFSTATCMDQDGPASCAMRIYQDEVYRKGAKFIRIVRLNRYEVEYKTMDGDPKGDGPIALATKKEFCRLLKGMELVPQKNKAAPEA